MPHMSNDEQFDNLSRSEPFEPAWSEATEPPGEQQQQQQQDAPVVEEIAPEPAPDYTDTTKWVAVDTPEQIDGSTLGQATAGFMIQTGNMIRTYRLRRPEDGDALVVRGIPPGPSEPKPREREQLKPGERSDWTPGVPDSLLRRFLGPEDPEAPGHQDSSSAFRWGRSFGRR